MTYAEVGEWQRLTSTLIRPEEVSALMRMDDAFLSEVREEQKAADARDREKRERRNG